MPADVSRLREHVKSFDFKRLFVEELGWDHHNAGPLEIAVGDSSYTLTALVEKRGLVVYLCDPGPDGKIPDSTTRRKIDKLVGRISHEHLIVYLDAPRTAQVWQWVRREPGRPTACREFTFHRGQSGEALAQRLHNLYFDLSEEDDATVVHAAAKVRAAFDVDRVTKRFYDRFKQEHSAFLRFVQGIGDVADREWYTSLTLNRLMFVYFIQKKGFLDGDVDYLRNRLRMMQGRQKKDQFLTFYRHFLLRLFHEGLGQPGSSPELDELLCKVPYLNGGLFDVHQLERSYPRIQIPDEAFERIFDFFDAYTWHLDDRPLRKDNEINPDVLGYIFEKYVNQKQMGAYYTKEDITEYIAKNTIIPFLFDAARKDCTIAFEPGSALWRLLQEDPDRYIYEAVRKGVDLPLPEDVAAGLNDVSKRGGWNRPADDDYALPTETWREHVARRLRCQEIRSKLHDGQIHSIDDLITYNLNIRQFAQDAIENCEGPELLRAFYHAIERVAVLDPTCGSGAFLFAALNVLYPLYEACLERMQGFLDDLERSREKHRPEKFSDFRKTLDRVKAHPNRPYFILKSIVVNNLYGVDIMEEAVEICKLRLFLKLAAQIEKPEDIEPLPDIDFNVRAGNTLVGFASLEEVKAALTISPGGQGKLLFGEDAAALSQIEERAEVVDRAFHQFHRLQTEHGAAAGAFAKAKDELRRRLSELASELDRLLAAQYGVDPDSLAFDTWRRSHQPFHWFVEFYGIIKRGGFDAVIGNPPYIVYDEQRLGYTVIAEVYATYEAKNLYAMVFERGVSIAGRASPVSLIVPLTSLTSERAPSLQNLLLQRGTLYAVSFPRRPESVFDGVEMPVSILTSVPRTERRFVTSRIRRFYTSERPAAIGATVLVPHRVRRDDFRIAKFGSDVEIAIYDKINRGTQALDTLVRESSPWILYYQEACRYWAKGLKGLPFFRRDGGESTPPHGRVLCWESDVAASYAVCLINSSLFYWFYSTFSDCEHLNDGLLRGFRLPGSLDGTNWPALCKRLVEDLEHHSRRRSIATKQGHVIEYDELKALYSKPIIDEIDRVLAKHYGFTDEELDFIINYDIKYRMGQGSSDDD